MSEQIFKLGTASLMVTLVATNELNLTTFFIYTSLLCISFFNDIAHWGMHMLGVFFLFLTCLIHVYTKGIFNFRIFLCVLIIYLLRLVIKFIALVDVREYMVFFMNSKFRTEIFRKGLYIMYHGSNDPTILILFKLCGVLQWISFYLLLNVIF